MVNSKEDLSFSDILKQEDYIICDTSLTSSPGLDWYWEGIYDAKSFSKINTELLREEIEYLGAFFKFLIAPNVCVPKGVSLELKRIRKIIGEKISFLGMKKPRGKNRTHDEEYHRKLIQEFHDLFNKSYTEAKRSSFIPRKKKEYKVLEKIVLSVTKHTHSKIDYMSLNHKAKKIPEDFHTDEQIVATALYLSLVERKKGGILTRDTDIERILPNTLSYLLFSNILNLERFLERIKIYHGRELGKAFCRFDNYKLWLSPDEGRLSDEIMNKINNDVGLSKIDLS